MLGERKTQTPQYTKKTYLNIKEGAIVKRTETGEEHYTSLEGSLISIVQRERTFHNEKVVYWYIDMKDERGEVYSLGFPFRSNTFKSIILALASATDYSRITIKPYSMNGYDKVICYEGENRLEWITRDLPPVEVVEIGGRKIKDDSKRLTLIGTLVKQIIGKLVNK